MATAPLSMVYRSDKQPQQLGQTLKDFLRNEEFCDVKLLVGTSQIQAHRVILAAFSPYFYQILKQSPTILTLHNFDERAVRSVIDFCYTGTIMVDTVTAEKLLPLAQTLQIREVEKLCRTFLTAQQSLTSEISPGRRQSFLPGTPSQRFREDNETVVVESSGRFSPRTSPSVSTSGRPSSEAGSIDNTDTEVMNIKTESIDETSSDSYTSLRPKRPTDLFQKSGFIMSQISPTHLRPSSAYSRPPPQLQLISSRFPSTSHLLSPQKTSSSKLEQAPQLLMMSPQKELSSTGCDASSPSPQEIAHQKGSSYLESDSSLQPSTSQDIVGQSVHQANLALQAAMDPDPSVGHQLSMMMCKICHQIFTSAESLQLHMISIHSHLTSKKPLKHHHRGNLEGNSKPLVACGTCGKLFKDTQALKFHRYNHILRFPCNLCGRRFSRSWNLHRHKKTHFKIEEFVSAESMIVTDTGQDHMTEGSADLTGMDTELESKATVTDQSGQTSDNENVAELLS